MERRKKCRKVVRTKKKLVTVINKTKVSRKVKNRVNRRPKIKVNRPKPEVIKNQSK